MKVDHVFGGHIYVISSFGVARNPIIKDNKDLAFFRSKVNKYLGEICEIYAYSHQINQFQYLVKIKERTELESFFHEKKARHQRMSRMSPTRSMINSPRFLQNLI